MRWWYAQNGETKGPAEDAEIRNLVEQGVLNSSSNIMQEGGSQWTTVGENESALGLGGATSAPPWGSAVSSAGGGGGGGQQPGYGGGQQQPAYGRIEPRQNSTETRPSIRTSEFIVFVVTSLLMVIVAYTEEAFNVEHGMTLVAVLAVGYMLSRGIAKAGTREPYRVER